MTSGISPKFLLAAIISLMAMHLIAQEEPALIGEAQAQQDARYPLEAINRPSVMPVGIFGIDAHSKLKNYKTVSIDAGINFGIVNKLQGSFSYDGLEINDFKAHRTVNLGTKYNYWGMPHISASLAANLPIHIADDGEIIREFTVGLPTVFYNKHVAGGILGDLFTLTMRPNIEMEFKFPLWFGGQIYGNLWGELSSSFGNIKMKNEKNQASWEAKAFWQEMPAKMTFLYAINHYFDLGVNAGFDNVMKAKDSFGVGMSFTVRGGKIFG
jgi:hypothetical protein